MFTEISLGKELANCSPGGYIWLTACFYLFSLYWKVLLEDSYIHLFTYCLWQPLPCMGRVMWLWQKPMAPQGLKMFPPDPLQMQLRSAMLPNCTTIIKDLQGPLGDDGSCLKWFYRWVMKQVTLWLSWSELSRVLLFAGDFFFLF